MKEMKAKVNFKGGSHWGGGRRSGGLSYTPKPLAEVYIGDDSVTIYFSELYYGSEEAIKAHSDLAEFLAKVRGETEMTDQVLFRDIWTGATLEAKTGSAEVDLSDHLYDGVLAVVRGYCCGIAHGMKSCQHKLRSRYSDDLVSDAINKYPEDWCGYGRVAE